MSIALAYQTTWKRDHGVVGKLLRHPHPYAPQVDHIVPVSQAPHLIMERSNLRLVHRRCNLRRGTGVRRRQPADINAVYWPLSTEGRPSRIWRTWGSW